MDASDIRPNKRRFTFGLYLLTGALPWGVDFDRGGKKVRSMPFIPAGVSIWTQRREKAHYPLCCGQVMSEDEAATWKAAGLLIDGPEDEFGRATVVAGPKLDRWVSDAWHQLRVHSWRRA